MKHHKFGLLGKNISYSFSRNYFTERFKNDKEEDKYSYVNFDIPAITSVAAILKEDGIKGLNVTIPYKQEVMPYLDSISKTAAKIGAVNTIHFSKKGKTKGYNTDWYGFYHSLKPLLKFRHKRALILGTGGASKAVAYALAKLKIDYRFVTRTKQHKNDLSYEELTEEIFSKYTIIINTTPLGTFPDVSQKAPIPYQFFSDRHIAYDLIYNPEETAFLTEAKKNGATIKNGYDMLVLQAERAWKIWHKK